MKQSQSEYVISLLKNYGNVSRNHCLEQRITRLGAIICSLNQNGWEIEGRFEKTKNGKDFIYRVLKMPFRKVVTYIPEIKKTIIRYEKTNETL